MNGILNVYKEPGFTSHDVVAKLRGICKQKKIGHTGTLDPEASGVLPVCLGNATKLCDLLTDKDKEYRAVLLLGVETDTQDTTGQILAEKKVNAGEEDVRSAILSFVGPFDRNRGHFTASRDDARGVLPRHLYPDALSRYRTEAGLRRSDGAAGTDTLRQFQS